MSTSKPITHAEAWDKWHDWNAAQMKPLTDWFCRATKASPGQSVLDVACGTGLPALALAERVGPRGRVVATDVAPEFVEIVTRRAREAKLEWVDARAMNAENIDAGDATFDIVTCSFGVMFCPDPARALAEMKRVLRPGGRFALSVWDQPQSCPFFTTAFGATSKALNLPPPDPKAPSMFSLGAPGALAGVLRKAGLPDFEIESQSITFESGSVEAHWDSLSDMAPPVRTAKSTLPADEVARLRAAIAEAIAPFVTNGRVRLPAVALTATGTK